MKGIILAGGKGTRLYPLTLAVSKQLLPINSKPTIYYSLSTLMLAGLKDILIITTSEDRASYERLLFNGTQWGIHISYAEQAQPRGLADAYNVGREFVGDCNSVLCLGDNIFYSHDLGRMIRDAIANNDGCTIFACEVKDPERYGIVEMTSDGKSPVSLEEKPQQPRSNLAVPGLYIYDNKVSKLVKTLKPSARGELEITDVNKIYLKNGTLKVVRMGRGTAWLDAGTFDALLQASNFVAAIEERQGLMVGCPEEIAFQQGWITKAQLQIQAARYKGNSYGDYLYRLLERA